jgi:hypothetical protein
MHRICTIILFTTSVWPSIWGWKAMDLVSLVSSSDQRLDQNVLINQLSRSKTMVFVIPKCTQTCSKNILAVASAVILFLQATRIAILRNRSTTTKTQSFPLLVDERPDMYSIEMDSHGLSGVGRWVYRPCFSMFSLAIV